MNEQDLDRQDWEIEPADFAKRRDAGEDILLLDCRNDTERRIACIEPSVLIPMDEIAPRMIEIDAYRNRPIVVHCRSGKRSLMVTAALRANGFTDVVSLAGGINRWAKEIDPSLNEY